MSNTTIEVTAANFDAEVLNSHIPVLVDLWAPWCGPCKAIAPVLEEIASQYANNLKVAKVNIDEETNQQIAKDYGVRSIPTLMIFKDGKVAETKVGALQKAQLEQLLTDNDITA